MDLIYIAEILRAVSVELRRYRRLFLVAVAVVAFAVLIFGAVSPKYYKTSVMLHADVTNIIAPLLAGRAEVTSIDRSEQARESIYTRRIITQVAQNAGLLSGDEPLEKVESVVAGLRNNIEVKAEGPNYFRMIYSNVDQETSFRVLNEVVDTFIRDAAERRRAESRSAYEFINEQVESYKRQLKMAEESLKEFKSTNIDGSEASVRQRIDTFRVKVEELAIQIDEAEERKRAVELQLREERRYLEGQGKVDEYHTRLAALQKQLDTLLLNYQETYPDVVAVREQIVELKKQAERDGADRPAYSSNTEVKNPLYEELRKRHAEAETDLRSLIMRKAATERLLEEERARAVRVAATQADLSELVRDYDVTREIYEEMLERKEKARLSMTLDIEGQGVSYRIQEPAVYPLKPAGLQLVHYAIIGPILGLLFPIGLVVAYVLFDPRIRIPSALLTSMPEEVELLAIVPAQDVPEEQAQRRRENKRSAIWLSLALAIYIAAVLLGSNGII